MSPPLYIPKTITVGFQTRSDTYTGKLAYVIYTDHTGKLRKEASWNTWRHKDIEPVTFDNTPQPNFTLNKGVQRSREWFGSGRSMIRVYDQRDFEFEITVDNLLNVLAHADVSKRDITEPCVYAWSGTNLVLLPTNSVEYEESQKHTAKQSLKVSAKDLVPGHSYMIKADANTIVVYLGRFPRYEMESVYGDSSYRRYQTGYTQKEKKSKSHVFINVETEEIIARDPSSYLAGVVDENVHSDFADLMSHYYSTVESQPVIGVRLVDQEAQSSYYRDWLWHQVNDTDFVLFHINNPERYRITADKYTYTAEAHKTVRWDAINKTLQYSHDGYHDRYYAYNNHPARVLPGLNKADFGSMAKEIAQAYTTAYQQAYAEHAAANPSPTNWGSEVAAQEVASSAVCKQFGLSNGLAMVLADGKSASNQHIYY